MVAKSEDSATLIPVSIYHCVLPCISIALSSASEVLHSIKNNVVGLWSRHANALLLLSSVNLFVSGLKFSQETSNCIMEPLTLST